MAKISTTTPGGFRQGAKFVINEGELKDLLEEMRAQRNAIDFIMNSIQLSVYLSEVLTLLTRSGSPSLSCMLLSPIQMLSRV